ncbi:unnamed protein product [Closterium sp. NIES-64]|nr:unnamed protein product [Closterium sp. NIES-64]
MAGKGAAVIARGWQLEQLVLTWSIEDIFNDELLQEKVRPIPSTFADVPSYLSAFRWPLLEECRAGLKRGLEQLSATASTRVVVRAVQRSGDRRAARTDVCGEVERDDWQRQSVSYFGDDGCQGEVRGSSVHSSAPDEIEPPWCMAPHGQPTGRCRGQLVGAGKAHSELACCDTEGFCYVRFEVQQQQPAGGAGAAARLQWGGAARLKPTDVVLLSTVAPSGPADLLCPGVLYRLAVLLVERNSSGEDGDDNRCFRAKICTPEGSPEYQGMVGAAWYVTFLGSLATPQRVWGALHDPVLEVGELGRGGAGTVEEGMEGDWRRRMFRELLCLEQRPGNGGLRAGMKRGGGEERELVQGPPGTGKTHTLSVLLSVALALGVRTLVCAPTNVAAAEVARRMLRLAMSPDTSSHFPGFCQAQQQQQQRHGWSSQLEKSFSTGGQLRVGDIVLLASEDRLAVDPELDLILLGEGRRREPGVFPKRKGCVCRGRVALSLQSGWRASVLTLMSFLENSADEMSRVHRAHLKMLEMWIREDLGWINSKTQSKKGTEGLPNLLEFFQERVAQLIDRALEGAVSLAHHLPSALLPERERVLLLQAGELLAALRHLLLCPGLSSDAVLSWLDGSHTGEEDDFEFSISSVLQETAVLLAPFENVDRGGGIKDCSSWAGRMLRLGTRGSINNQAAASATTSTSESFAISNDSTAASSSTRDARISLPQAECLFHSIRRHLKHIAKQSPAFHIPTLSSNPSAATVATQCVAGARLVLSTVSSSARALVRCSGHFPLLLLDEAAQLVEAESLVALQARGLRYAVLVGDPKQLPATVMSKVAVQGHYNRSLFERLQSTGWHAELLSVQYRMHPDISRFPSHGFYHGRIEDGPNVCQPSHCPPHLHLLFGPYRFFHVRGREERDSAAVDAGSRSVSNSVEAAVVIALLTRLSTACQGKEGGGAVKVGLISPYARQVELLQRAVEAKPWPSLTVEVNTVDGFQGRECDVVVVSTVRSNSSRSIGFVADPRRLNVAITRARHALWVVGDAHTLQRGDNMWAQLVQDAERRGCLVEAGSNEGLARAVERRWVQVGEAQQLLKPHSGLWVGLHWECSAGCRFDPRCSVCTLSPPFPPFPSSAPRFLLSAPLRRASRPPAAHYRQAEFSQEFQRSMRQAPSLEVINAVRRLMQGHRPQWDTRPRHELSDPRYHDIIHVQPVGRAFLIWTVDISQETYQQIIKVWDVVPERGVLPWLHRLAKGLASFSDQRLDCCAASAPGSARRVRPRQFSRVVEGAADPPTARHGQDDSDHPPPAAAGAHVPPRHGREAPSHSCGHWTQQCLAGQRAGRLGDMTMLQAEEHGGAWLPNGRAGRGEGEKQSPPAGEEGQDELLLLEEAEEKLLGDLPEALDSVAPAAFPLVLTFKKLLSMVNATLSHPFQMERSSTGSGWGRGGSMGGRWSGNGLPGGMNAVWDEENDEDDYKEVDYERFEAVYWPRLNAATTRYLDASAVFKEIFSHIKGSLHALRTPHGRVSLQDYVLLARTRTSSLNEEQRAAVYGLFLQYERLKWQRGDHDMCDYVFHVYKQLEKGATRLWTPAAAATGSAYGSTSSPHHGSRPGISSTAIGTSRAVGGGGKVVAGPPFQYVYVDEVQDLTQAQIAMLQFLCSNVACGFFFAGDTAQTIARGVDFRFQDIRRLFFELFLGKGTAASVADGVERSEEVDAGRGETGGGVSGREIVESGGVDEAKEGRCGGEKGGVCKKQGRWARAIESRGRQRQSARGKRIQEEVRGEGSAGKEATVLKPCAAFSKGGAGTGIITAEAAIDKVAGTRNGGEEDARKGQVEDRSSCTEMPDLLFLSQNFRSHSGIVRVADSVVRLLLHFFPHSVDRLQPEFSQQQGEPPVFLQSTGSRDRVAQLFGKRGGIGGGGCEFGAEQDALIYNFFSHSLLASGWRLLYEYMRQHHLIPSTAQSSSSSQWQCPAFDPRRHNLMCSELKQLYVVLTRARQRLWIYEEDEAARQPAMDLWKAMGLVVVRPLTTDLIASMHTESSPEKWHKRGLEMFNAGQFEAAKMSFERAGDERRAAVAQAALLQQTAKRLQGTDHWRACRTFLEAAQAFLAVDRPRDAAGCLASAGEMERAGYTRGGKWGRGRELVWVNMGGGRAVIACLCWTAATYRNMCKPPQWEKAAACYLQAGKASDAAECLAQAWLVERALAVCSQARLYNLGLSLIHSWQAQIADGLRAVKGKDKQEQHQSQHWVSGDMSGSSSNGLVPPLSVNSAGGGGTFASSLESARWEGESAQKVARESSTALCAPGEGETWKMRQGLITRLSSDFLRDAAKFFYRKKDRGKMMKYVLRFPAAAEKRRFLERRDLFEELLQVEVAEGNFERAATAKLKKGDMLGAAEMFVQQTMWGRAFDCAMEAARVASMWANGNNGWPLNCSSSMRREGGEEQEEEEDKEVGECAQVTTGRNDGWSWRSEVRKWIGRGAAVRVEGVGEEGKKSWSGGSRNALELAVAIWLTQEEASVCRGAGMVAGFVTREGERGSGKEARRLARSQHMGGSAEQGEGAREGEREVDAEQGLEALTLLLLSEWIQLKGGTGDMETLWCRLTSWERGRSIAAEVLCSWKALELSVEKFNLLSHTTSSLSAAPPLTSTAAPLPNTEHLPSRIRVLRQPQPVQASVGGWRRPLGGGGQQGMQQVQQGVTSEQPRDESWPGGFQQLVAQVEEVQRWWGEWSERAARMLAALQRLCRRREVPADQPWLDAAFHLLAATPPTASSTAGVVSTAAHTAPPTLDLPTHSILVGLSCASWLLPVRAAVTRLPNQGTRGEVAREAAAEAGAIYWSRQVVAVVQGCLQVLDVAMCRTSVALQQMGRGNELMLRGMGRQLPGPVVAQGGCKVHNFQQQQQQGAAREGISHAALLRLQCKWLVQYLEMLERALQCCNGATKASQRPHGHSTTDWVSSKEGNGHKSAEARELEGAASMLERLQDSLAQRLLQHVMPVGAPLPRDVALLAAEVRAQESTAFALHCWALRLLAQCVDGATRQDSVTRDKEGVVWGSIGLGSDMHEPVLLALLGDLLLVLPLLGPRWVHRHGGELLQRQSSLPPVHAAVLRAVVHEDAVRLFLEQRHSHGAAVTLASTEWVAALLEALTVSSEYQLKSQLTRLHGVIKSLLQQQGALQQQWGSSSDAAGDSTPHFLRLLTLLLASSANVPAFHNSTAAFLRDLWRCNGSLLLQLPHLIRTKFSAVLGGNRPNPNALHDCFSWAMFKLGDPWIVLRRKGSPFIHTHQWIVKLKRFNVEKRLVMSATQGGAANVPHSPQANAKEGWVPGVDTRPLEYSVFSLVELTGRESAGRVGGGAIADWEAEGGEGREEEWEEEREGASGERSEEWGGAEGLVAEEGLEPEEEGEEEVEGEFDVEGMAEEKGNEGVDAESGFERGCGKEREGDDREEVDGVKIAVRVTATLRQLLLEARERLQQELPPLERSRREAKRGLSVLLHTRSKAVREFYITEYLDHASPLEVKASAFLALVHSAVLAMKARLGTAQDGGAQTGGRDPWEQTGGYGGMKGSMGDIALEEQIEKEDQLLDDAADAAEELEAAMAVLHHAYVMKHKMPLVCISIMATPQSHTSSIDPPLTKAALSGAAFEGNIVLSQYTANSQCMGGVAVRGGVR